MPKIRLTAQQALDDLVAHNIRVIGTRHDLRSDVKIAKMANIPESTFSKKMNELRKFRLAELYQIADSLKVPITALFEK